MTFADNKELVESFYAVVFQDHRLDALDLYMEDDYIQHNPEAAQGKKGFIEFFTELFGAFPDFKATIKMMAAEDDMVFVYNVITGTHTGAERHGRPAEGSKINFDVVDMFRIANGKLAEHWDVADTRTLFAQLGVTG